MPTHYHFDHVGGNEDLRRAPSPACASMARAAKTAASPRRLHEVDDGGAVEIGALRGRVIGIPAHTNGHIAYYFPQLKAVFTGDTLFIAGCGRVFEGKAETMVSSWQKLAALPDEPRSIAAMNTPRRTSASRSRSSRTTRRSRAKHEWTQKKRAARASSPSHQLSAKKRASIHFCARIARELRASLKKIDPSIGDDTVAIFAKTRELKDRF